MYQREHLTIGDWIGYHIFMLMPVINVIVWIMLIRNKDTNRTLKSFMVAQFVILIMFIIAGFVFGTAIMAFSEQLPSSY
jgi:hypothetical protein